MFYFNHDTNASRSPDLTAMRADKGSGAVDAYWMIVELIHENETALVFGKNQMLTKAVSSWLATDAETLMDWLDYMVEIGLLVRTDNQDDSFSITSNRANANIAAYHQKAETARQNGKKGGRKPKQNQGETKPVSNGKPAAKLSKSKRKRSNTFSNENVSVEQKPEKADPIPYAAIIDHLNERTGKRFNATTEAHRKFIRARWNEGYRLDDFTRVIDTMCAKWLRPPKNGEKDMRRYCRPETLFGTKFDSYLNEEKPKEEVQSGLFDKFREDDVRVLR